MVENELGCSQPSGSLRFIVPQGEKHNSWQIRNSVHSSIWRREVYYVLNQEDICAPQYHWNALRLDING